MTKTYYYLHVCNVTGREQHTPAPPPMLPYLRVEILAQGDGEFVERTYTYDRTDGTPVEPPNGINEDRWTIDDHAPPQAGSTAWIRVR